MPSTRISFHPGLGSQGSARAVLGLGAHGWVTLVGTSYGQDLIFVWKVKSAGIRGFSLFWGYGAFLPVVHPGLVVLTGALVIPGLHSFAMVSLPSLSSPNPWLSPHVPSCCSTGPFTAEDSLGWGGSFL